MDGPRRSLATDIPWAACVVDRVFPFEEIIETDLYLETNQQFGKIVVTV